MYEINLHKAEKYNCCFLLDCHPQCQYCVANLHDTGSVCLKCQYSRYYFLGDRCIPECPAGFFVEGRNCKGKAQM